jgi:hypothetical protein
MGRSSRQRQVRLPFVVSVPARSARPDPSRTLELQLHGHPGDRLHSYASYIPPFAGRIGRRSFEPTRTISRENEVVREVRRSNGGPELPYRSVESCIAGRRARHSAPDRRIAGERVPRVDHARCRRTRDRGAPRLWMTHAVPRSELIPEPRLQAPPAAPPRRARLRGPHGAGRLTPRSAPPERTALTPTARHNDGSR